MPQSPEVPNDNFKVLEIKDSLDKGILKLKLILFRHGPKKDASGEKNVLSDSFNEQVGAGVDALGVDQGANVHITSSPIERAIKTAKLSGDILGDEKTRSKTEVKMKPENPRLGLSEKIESELEIIAEYQRKLEEKIRARKENVGKDFADSQTSRELKNEIDSTILRSIFDGEADALGNELGLKAVINLKTEDFSQNLEEYTKGYFTHLNILNPKPGDESISLSVTHSYPIMCFLKNNLKFIEGEVITSARDMNGEDFLEKIGGCVDEAGAIFLDYMQNGDRKIIKVIGKKFEGYIDYE